MIKSSTQVTLADGRQWLTFTATTSPTSATFLWEGGSFTTEVTYDADSNSFVTYALVPSDRFTVKLNSEEKLMDYESQWGEAYPKEATELEYENFEDQWWTFKVPYCDLATVDLRFYSNTNDPLDVWSGRTKKAWALSSIDVEFRYGAPTLIANLRVFYSGTVAREANGGVNWFNLSELPGGFIVQVDSHSRVTTDRIVNATICRDSLYGKNYRRRVI